DRRPCQVELTLVVRTVRRLGGWLGRRLFNRYRLGPPIIGAGSRHGRAGLLLGRTVRHWVDGSRRRNVEDSSKSDLRPTPCSVAAAVGTAPEPGHTGVAPLSVHGTSTVSFPSPRGWHFLTQASPMASMSVVCPIVAPVALG